MTPRKDTLAQEEDMSLEPDIVERLWADFSAADFPTALSMLTNSRNRGGLARCIVVAADGSLEAMKECMRRGDDRDIIMAGEYNSYMGSSTRVRSLSVSFLINSPLDFWVIRVAGILYESGYKLIAVTSQEAVEPFEYMCDYGEGAATFNGPGGTISIFKENRQWHAASATIDFTTHELDVGWPDEDAFATRLRHLLHGWLQPG
jgi:hypothetical protein